MIYPRHLRRRVVRELLADRLLDERVRVAVHRAGGLVEQQQQHVGADERPRQAHLLPLAQREVLTYQALAKKRKKGGASLQKEGQNEVPRAF